MALPVALILSLLSGPAQQVQSPESDLTPLIVFDTPALEFDFPGLLIGTAEYAEGPTGATIFVFPGGATAAVDIRGGAPGTIGTDTLQLGYDAAYVSAISLAGGSGYGLEFAAGAQAEILARRNYSGSWDDVAVVPGAIIFDLEPRRFNTVYPDKRLGRAAVAGAQEGRFYQGARGAGRFAMQGSYFGPRQYSGQGGAFRQVGPTKVAVFTVVNAAGTVVDREGNVVRCADPGPKGCGPIEVRVKRRLEGLIPDEPTRSGLTRNTTITLVVTNQKLSWAQLKRVAIQVHSSMARGIQPFHTEVDGDTLFAASTGAVENPGVSPRDLGVVASEAAWDAILASVPELDDEPRGEFIRLEADRLDPLAGRYRFGANGELTVAVEGGRVFAEATGKQSIYGFGVGQRVEIFPVSATDFLRRDPASPLLRFAPGSLTLNPGHWPVRAIKLDD